jgi:hypothetical protein
MIHTIKLKTNVIIPILRSIFSFVFETQLQFQWESKLFTYNAQAKRKIRRVLAEGQRVIAHTSEEKFDASAREHF